MAIPQNLEMAKSFEAAGFNLPQAHALASVTSGIESRLENLEHGVRDLRQEMREQRQEMRDLRQEMRKQRQETQAGFEALRQEMREISQRVDATNQNLHTMTWRLIMAMIGLQSLFGGILLAAFKLFFT